MSKHENLYLRGRTWYFRFKMHGRKKPFAGSCFTHDLREAKRVLRDKMAEAQASPMTPTVATTRYMTTAEMRDWDFRRARFKGSSEEIIASTLGFRWRRIMKTFQHANEITADTIASYVLHHLDARTVGEKSLKEDLWALKRAYEYAQERDPSLPNLGKLPPLTRPDPGKGKGVVVPLDVATAFFARLKGHARAKAMVSLFTAIRKEELKRFELSWLSQIIVNKRKWCLLSLPAKATKGKKPRKLVVSLAVESLLREHGPFRIDPRTAWETASRHAGFSKAIAMRDLRKTFASNLAPFDWPGTKLVMGHTKDRDEDVAMLYQEVDNARLARIAERAEHIFSFALPLSASGKVRH